MHCMGCPRGNGVPLHAQSFSPQAGRGRAIVCGAEGHPGTEQAAPVPVICVAVPAVGDGWVCAGRAVKTCYSDEKIIEWL